MKRILDDIVIFCAVVETGSLKKASEKLSVPHSTVSRRIEALENNLGLTLLHRTTRDVQVSSRGQALYEETVQHIDNIKASIVIAIDDEVTFKGKLSVSMPVRAGIDFLGAWLIDFVSTHQQLELDISLSNDNKNLIKDDIDLAFRVGPLIDSSAIAIPLWDIPYGFYCHQSLFETLDLQSTALSIEEIANLPAVVSNPITHWAVHDVTNREQLISPNKKLTVDDLGLALHSVEQGQCIAMLPKVMVNNENVIELTIEGFAPRTRKMYAYYLGKRHAQSQIKHVIAYIKDRYHKENTK